VSVASLVSGTRSTYAGIHPAFCSEFTVDAGLAALGAESERA